MAPNGNDPSVDKAFELLQQGKTHEGKGELWKAATAFVQARDLLQALAGDSGKTDGDSEAAKIHQLYREQATAYLHHARKCLISGMEKEKEADEAGSGTAPPAFESLSDDDAKARTDAFCALFSKPVALAAAAADEPPSLTTSDIESRLLELNASLPSGFKTSDERMKDINRGLNRLGLSSLYTQTEKPKLQEEDLVPKSEDEQIAEIMAQARDEVATNAENPMPAAVGARAKQDHDDDDDDDDLSSTDSEDTEIVDRKTLQSDNCDDIISVLTIRKKVVKAQVRLAEVIALLDEAKVALDREEEEAELLGEDAIDHKGSAVALGQGKTKLRKAKKDLRKALTEWKESDLP